jgi:hypothetical protein
VGARLAGLNDRKPEENGIRALRCEAKTFNESPKSNAKKARQKTGYTALVWNSKYPAAALAEAGRKANKRAPQEPRYVASRFHWFCI